MKALDRYKRNDAPPTPEPTEAHVRAIGFIDEMVTTMLAQNTALSPIVRMLQRMRPALLRDLATIPEEQLTAFLVDLGSRMIRAGGMVAVALPVTVDVPPIENVEPQPLYDVCADCGHIYDDHYPSPSRLSGRIYDNHSGCVMGGCKCVQFVCQVGVEMTATGPRVAESVTNGSRPHSG